MDRKKFSDYKKALTAVLQQPEQIDGVVQTEAIKLKAGALAAVYQRAAELYQAGKLSRETFAQALSLRDDIHKLTAAL